MKRLQESSPSNLHISNVESQRTEEIGRVDCFHPQDSCTIPKAPHGRPHKHVSAVHSKRRCGPAARGTHLPGGHADAEAHGSCCATLRPILLYLWNAVSRVGIYSVGAAVAKQGAELDVTAAAGEQMPCMATTAWLLICKSSVLAGTVCFLW